MKLLVTADDFGYSKDTFLETIKFHENGILNNISIMSGMPLSEDALRYAASTPNFSYGVHLTFSRDSTESSVLKNLKTLTDGNGLFYPGRSAQIKSILSLFSLDEIKNEMRAQLDVACRYIDISYVDSHMHLHKYPIFQKALNEILPEYSITKVRSPQNLYCKPETLTMTKVMGHSWRRRLCSSFTSTDYFFMETKRSKFTDLILPDSDTIEVGIHPGTLEEWRVNEISSFMRFYEREKSRHYVDWRAL